MSTSSASHLSGRELVRGLILLVTLLPLFFFPNLISLYRLPKETLLAFLSAVLSWLWLLSLTRQRDRETIGLPLFFPLFSYALAAGLSLLYALNPYEGMRHFFNLLLGITLFWITANYVRRESVPSFLRWIAVTGVAVSLIGIVQTWGVEIPALVQTGPPGSTFGNRNMAAQYILFVLPVTYYLLLASSDPRQEWLYSLIAAIVTTYLIYTGARAAWGATAVAAMLLWLCLKARGAEPRKLLSFGKRKWSCLSGIAIFVLAMNTIPRYIIPSFGADPTWKRLQSMVELESDLAAQVRFAMWANSLAIFKDHLLLGAGKGNLQFIYPLYNRRVVEDPLFSVDQKPADAHNDYIQLLAEVGALGTAAFLLILALVAQRYWRSLKERFDPLILPVGFGLTAILLNAFWDFPFVHPVPITFFWIYAGLLWALTRQETPQSVPRVSGKLTSTAVISLALCATAALIISFMHLRSEFYFSRALLGEYKIPNIVEKLRQAEKDFNQAIGLYPFDYRYHYWQAILMLRNGKPEAALQANLRALTLNPYHINTLHNLAVTYTALGNIPKAIHAYEAALKIWPGYTHAHNNLAQLHEETGAKEKAIHAYKQTLRLDPKNKLARERLATLLNESRQ